MHLLERRNVEIEEEREYMNEETRQYLDELYTKLQDETLTDRDKIELLIVNVRLLESLVSLLSEQIETEREERTNNHLMLMQDFLNTEEQLQEILLKQDDIFYILKSMR